MKPFDKKNVEDVFSLTPLQESILYYTLKNPGSQVYREQLRLDLNGPLRPDIFKQAWQTVCRDNPMLRALFRWEAVKQPVQVILKEQEINPRYIDLSYLEENKHAREQRLREIREQDLGTPFDLRETPFRLVLCKRAEDRHTLFITNHHILYDGWSNGVLLKEFFTAYRELKAGNTPPKPAKFAFKDYVKWLQQRDNGGAEEEAFWNRYLEGREAEETPERKRTAKKEGGVIHTRLSYGGDEKRAVDRFLKKYRLTSSALVYTAWGLLLQSYSNREDVLFDTTVSGRSGGPGLKDVEETVGLFINTLPLRVTAPPETPVPDLLRQTSHHLRERGAFETTSRLKVNEILEAHGGPHPLESLVVVENYPLDKDAMALPGVLEVETFSVAGRSTYDITLMVTDFHRLDIDFATRENLFGGEDARQLVRRFDALLKEIIRDPSQKTARLPGAPEPEKARLLRILQEEQAAGESPGQAVRLPENNLQARLAEIWARVLKVEPNRIGIDDDFFSFGGHSLKASLMLARVYGAFQVKIPLARFFADPTIAGLAQHAGNTARDETAPPAPAEEKEYYPLSSTQLRLYMMQQVDPMGLAYNGPVFTRLEGPLDIQRLENSIKQLIRRHEGLRTRFVETGGQPVQIITPAPTPSFTLQKLTLSDPKDLPALKHSFIKPFDLSRPPLLRAAVVETGPGRHLLMLDMHHIITDGVSTATLLRELSAHYRGEALPAPAYRYRDFSQWQHRRLLSGALNPQRDYWLNRLSGPLPPLDLPTDFKRPRRLDSRGGRVRVSIEDLLFRETETYIHQRGSTWYMFLLALFNILLSRYARREDIITGTPVAGRGRPEFQDTAGLFMDGLAMRIAISPGGDFNRFLQEVKTVTLEAFDNGDYPLGELTAQLQLPREPNRNPLFDVLLNVRDREFSQLELEGLTLTPEPWDMNIAKMDLTLEAVRQPDRLDLELEFRAGLFKPSTVERMAGHLTHLAAQAVRQPDTTPAYLDMVTEPEKQQVLESFNKKPLPPRYTGTLHGFFQQQADRTPHRTAVLAAGQKLSYQELDALSNRVANYLLRETGLRRGGGVVLPMESSVMLVTAVLGVLKAGGCYIPIDTALPPERIRRIVKDTAAAAGIGCGARLELMHQLLWECPNFDTFLCLDRGGAHAMDPAGEEDQTAEGVPSWKHHQQVWDFIGETGKDDIESGGWLSSYTGRPLPPAEMAEYRDNVLQKLAPHLRPDMRVLEIGCASGLTMYAVAPRAGLYYGTDLSPVIIEKNKEKVAREQHRNIKLRALPAHEIGTLEEKDFDLVIINSVIQDFGGFMYLRTVLRAVISQMAANGLIFVGDVMDLDKKQDLLRDLRDFQAANRGKNLKTKLDWDQELFVPGAYFTQLAHDLPEVGGVEFSRKIHTLENELTRFRYDVLISIDKTAPKTGNRKSLHNLKRGHGLEVLEAHGVSRPNPEVGGEDPAYILFTSGTTGVPRGVVVEHRNVAGYVEAFDRQFNLSPEDVVMQQASPGFDVMVEELYPVLFAGGAVAVPAPEDLQTGETIAGFIAHHGVTLISVSPLMLRMLNQLEDTSPLASIHTYISGGDVLTADCMDRLVKHARVFNTYGPTESTVCATYYPCPEEPGGNIPIGKPIHGYTCLVLSPAHRLQPVGGPGELAIGGPGVTRGYLNRPELTAQKFLLSNHRNALGSHIGLPLHPSPAASAGTPTKGDTQSPPQSFNRSHWSHRSYRSYLSYPQAPLYLTGDLVRFLDDGNIEFLGRIDRQVKIRGYRIEVTEIEQRLREHEAIEDAVILTEDAAANEKSLHAYIIPAAGHDLQVPQLREYLGKKLPQYMLPARFTQMKTFPLTPSGKIDPKAFPGKGSRVSMGAPYRAPSSPAETLLARIYHRLLGHENIGIDDDFFALGGHSLKAVALASQVYDHFSIRVSLPDLFRRPTIKQLAQLVGRAKQIEQEPYHITPAPQQDFYPATSQQRRLYAMETTASMGAAYNISRLFRLRGKIDPATIQSAFQTIVQRHAALRTSFHLQDGQIVQRVAPSVPFTVETIKPHAPFIRPFDLSRAPLMRVALAQEGPDRALLTLDIHHIISDGVSMEILAHQFKTLLSGATLGPQKMQYIDYSHWTHGRDYALMLQQQENYWKEQYNADIPRLNLPADMPRPTNPGFRGKNIHFTTSPTVADHVEDVAGQRGMTPYMVFLALFNLLLAKCCNQEDIIIGTPVSGRRGSQLEGIIGMFVNTLALRNRPEGHMTLESFLAEVKENTLPAFENQDYPFEGLVGLVAHSNAAGGGGPLLDVLFVLQDNDMSAQTPPGTEISITPLDLENTTAKFDLTLEIIHTEDTWKVCLEYDTDRFLEDTARTLLNYYRHLLETTCTGFDTETKLNAIQLLPSQEKNISLLSLNNTRTSYSKNKTIGCLFRQQALRTPDRTAVTGTNFSVTYGALHERTAKLARRLRAGGLQPGSIAAVHMERSLELVETILAILIAGAVYLPLDPRYPQERIDYILKDSGAVPAETVLAQCQASTVASPCRPKGSWGSRGSLPLALPAQGPPEAMRHTVLDAAPPAPTSAAYIIYTSGSTGRPKGVVVEHASAVNLLFALQEAYPLNPGDTYLLKTNITFDVSVSELFGWFMDGGRLALLPPGGEKVPPTITETIEAHHVTHINFVPSMFQLFLEYLAQYPEAVPQNNSLKYIFLAGEALLPQLVTQYRNLNLPAHLENIYGPTEATVYAARFSLKHWHPPTAVPIGKPLPNVQLYIADQNNTPQPPLVPGELLIQGAGTARGYLNQPELTAERFPTLPPAALRGASRRAPTRGAPGGGSPWTPDCPAGGALGAVVYKTGDLARLSPNSNIQYLGRIDEQVKIRGFRIEPGEIQNRLLEHPQVQEAVVTVFSHHGDNHLYAYAVTSAAPEMLKTYLEEHLPYYMVPGYIRVMDTLPLTPSGKIDRSALPLPGTGSPGHGNRYSPPENQREAQLLQLWQEVLPLNAESVIGREDRFFHLGGHSLNALRLLHRLEHTFGVPVSLSELFQHSTLKNLARFIHQKQRTGPPAVSPAEERDHYPLTPAQHHLYIQQHMAPENTAYNMPSALKITGPIDRRQLEHAFQQLVQHHEILRTAFITVDGEPRQKPRAGAPPRFKIPSGTCEKNTDTLMEEFVKPFDLSRAPSIRAQLVQTGEDTFILMIDLHHIIADGGTLDILYNHLAAFYRGESPQPPSLRYKDYALRQHTLLTQPDPQFHRMESYWLNLFPEGIPSLDLPLDFPRRPEQSFDGETLEFRAGEPGPLHQAARNLETTPFMLLLAAFSLLLSRISNQLETVTGTPATGRRHAQLERTAGMFVNTLAIKAMPQEDQPLTHFLGQIKSTVLDAFENQDYPFEALGEHFPPDAALQPETLFVFMQQGAPELHIPGLELHPLPYTHRTAKNDLTLVAEESTRGLVFTFQYAPGLFKKSTVQRFAGFFQRILDTLVRRPEINTGEIDILAPAEKQQILEEFNNTEAPYPTAVTVHDLFRRQVEKTPHHIAAVADEKPGQDNLHLSYRCLDRASALCAQRLISRGLRPNLPVALLMEPSPAMLTAVLGILKAGAPYLPLDPEYPQERIAYILADSAASVLLTSLPPLQERLTARTDRFVTCPSGNLPPGQAAPPPGQTSPLPLGVEIIDINELLPHAPGEMQDVGGVSDWDRLQTCPYDSESARNDWNDGNESDRPAYIIYTSGTSGNPRGVVVEHRSLVNLCTWHNRCFAVTSRDRASKFAGPGFDATVWEIFPNLLAGAALCFVPRPLTYDPDGLNRFLRTRCVTAAFLPTPVAEAFMSLENHTLRLLLTGGDKLRFFKKQSYQVHNNYGPTENTVVATSCLISEATGDIPIGTPIDNNRIYILAPTTTRLQPTGIYGELCIAGDSLARGYLNRPELTAEKFVLLEISNAPGSQAILYKTGDLARLLPDGNIQFGGRLDQQVQIRGFRVEPREIEHLLLKRPDVADCVAVAPGAENSASGLYCYYVPAGPPVDDDELHRYLSQRLPAYMVPSGFMPLEAIPLTANGKVNRRALPPPPTRPAAGEPEDPLERDLALIWARFLDLSPAAVGRDADFFRLGGHSLKATRLAALIEKELGAVLPLTDIFRHSSLVEMARRIRAAAPARHMPIQPLEQKEYYPLSSAQKRMYVLNQLKKAGDTSDNTPEVVILRGPLDRETFEDVVRRLIHRHEVLRTAFITIDGVPVQRIFPPQEISFHIDKSFEGAVHGMEGAMRGNNGSLRRGVADFIRPFDLSRAPLLRMKLVELGTDEYVLMHDMHHIIRDGTSAWIFIREFFAMYKGESLPGPRVQYKDFCAWQNRLLETPEVARQEQYWLDVFSGAAAIPPLALPLDFPRPRVQDFSGDHIDFQWGPGLSRGVLETAAGADATLYMVLLAIYNILLARAGGLRDIVVGTPIAGRRHADTVDMIGMFVNTLAIRNFPAHDKSFTRFLGEVKQNALGAYENQDYQFDRLVNRLGLEPDPARHVLFDTMFALQNTGPDTPDLPEMDGELVVEPVTFEEKITQFDIILHAFERDGCINFRLRYATALFKPHTFETLIQQFQRAAETVTANPGVNIGEIDLLSQEERENLVSSSRKSKLEELDLDLEF